jgi:hypothetical protein
MVLLDGAAPPSDAYKATVIAGILKEHKTVGKEYRDLRT